MILRFAAEREIETSYAAWRLGTPTPYSIVAVTKARVAKLPLPDWVAFMDRHPQIKQGFEYEVMQLMSEIMAHTITLHLLDAPGRVHRFMRKHDELFDRLPKKELASYLQHLGRDAEPAQAPGQDLTAAEAYGVAPAGSLEAVGQAADALDLDLDRCCPASSRRRRPTCRRG
jgi:CRP-like cAMP-binding protein